MTITTTAAGNPDFAALVATLGFLDDTLGTTLISDLDQPGANLTVFAPTNAAFGQLAADLGFTGDTGDVSAVAGFLTTNVPAETLLAVIQYHVAPGLVTAADIAAAGTVTTLNGTITADLPTLVDAEPDLIDPSLTATDLDAGNGLIHVIDRVLLPVDLPGNDAATITGIVAASGDGFDTNGADFDILLAAVQTAGLGATLDDADADFTAFAPTDDAFVGLATALGFDGTDEAGAWTYLVDALTLLGGGDPIPLLTEVLTYHVAGESLQLSQVAAAGAVTTLQGGTITVDGTSLVDADPDVPNPGLVATDIQAANGVVHVIDGVLLPADVLASDGAGDVDFIVGTDGRDVAVTGKDADLVSGLGGRDTIILGKGDDTGLGGAGSDLIKGGKGDDLLSGGADTDFMHGGRGDDAMEGGDGSDFMRGNRGADTISGNDGADFVGGGRGADMLMGGAGRDAVHGGHGRDTINGGEGRDLLKGGRGDDVFVFEQGTGRDTVIGFRAGEDQIDLTAFGFDDFDAVKDAMSGHRNGKIIDLGDGDAVLLGIRGNKTLTEDDFIL